MAPIQKRNRQQGSVVIEAVFSITLIFLIIGVFLFVSYIGFAKLWIRSNLGESLICVAEGSPLYRCRRQFRKRINTVILFGEIKKFKIQHNKPHIKGHIQWQIDAQPFLSKLNRPWTIDERQELNTQQLTKKFSRLKRVFL